MYTAKLTQSHALLNEITHLRKEQQQQKWNDCLMHSLILLNEFFTGESGVRIDE